MAVHVILNRKKRIQKIATTITTRKTATTSTTTIVEVEKHKQVNEPRQSKKEVFPV
jgi:hypothetical protein